MFSLWKYPLPLSFTDEHGDVCAAHPEAMPEDEPELEFIGFAFGDSIQNASIALEDLVHLDMEDSYGGHISDAGINGPYAMAHLTDRTFDYEIMAFALVPSRSESMAVCYGVKRT